MDKKIDITLSEQQMELVLKNVSTYILNEEIGNEISSAIPTDDLYPIALTSDELEELIGSISFVANHEDTDELLAETLDELSEHLESYLKLY